MLVDAIISALDGGTPYGDTDMAFFGGTPTTYGPVDDPTPSTSGAIATPSTTTLPSETTVPFRDFAGDFYYRIWAVPTVLRASNPRVGVPIPFHIWNAYPEPNTLETIVGAGDASLALDVVPPSAFFAVEYRVINVTIINSDSPEIDASYLFTFDEGSTTFDFLATVVEFIRFRPDVPVNEVWSWLTDLQTSWDSSEQRISLRGYPRKRIGYTMLVANEEERREQYDRWYRSVGEDLIIPTFQYATFITQPSAIGDSKVFCDPSSIDLRAGENAVIVDPRTEAGFFITVTAINVDGFQLQSPLTDPVAKGLVIAAAHRSRVIDNTGINMKNVWGQVPLTASVFDYDTREGLTRPNNLATLTFFNSLPVLEPRPSAVNDVGELFQRGFQELDNSVGKVELKKSWPHGFPLGSRDFLVHRELDPISMDYWRVFCDYATGRKNPFYLSTWRQDLTPFVMPTVGSSNLQIIEGRYVTDYFPFPTFQQLEIEFADGSLLWARVLTSVLEPDGTATLVISAEFVETAITRISFLNLTRFNSDDVQLVHDHIDTTITVAVRAVDA